MQGNSFFFALYVIQSIYIYRIGEVRMNFTEINDNGTVEGFCLVKNLEVKKTAKGIPYLDLVLTDSSGEIGAKLWDYKK